MTQLDNNSSVNEPSFSNIYCTSQRSLKSQSIFAKKDLKKKKSSQLSQQDPDEENTLDFLGSYKSDQDEDYSEKEDLIQNKKFYAKDFIKPFERTIPKTEVEFLLKEQVDQQHNNGSSSPLEHSPYHQINDLSQTSLMQVPRQYQLVNYHKQRVDLASRTVLGKRSPMKPRHTSEYQEFL